MLNIVEIVLAIVYNLVILTGTAYLVQFHDWNPWWFLLAVGLLASHRKDEK